MSGLTAIDKRYLEKILGMGSGYVMDFSDATFGDFFDRFGVDIHSERYQTIGHSKAKKMRSFWSQDPNALVAKVLTEMLDSYEADCDLNDRKLDERLLKKCRSIVAGLTGATSEENAESSLDTFLHQEFDVPNLHRLPVEAPVATIIEGRLKEARRALQAQAYLSVIFLCGSVLEAVLLGAAQNAAEKFNRSNASPKDGEGKPKQFPSWTLSEFIDVACDVGVIAPDVKKFSHGLRDFRNYIHPYAQMVSGFTPDEHTAKVCFQVLKAALASVAGERH